MKCIDCISWSCVILLIIILYFCVLDTIEYFNNIHNDDNDGNSDSNISSNALKLLTYNLRSLF
jgi:hypothetical protein